MSGKPEDDQQLPASDGIELLVAAATLQDSLRAEKRRILQNQIPKPPGTAVVNKENADRARTSKGDPMDLRKSSVVPGHEKQEPAIAAHPSSLFDPSTSMPAAARVSAFTPTNSHISIPGTPTGNGPLSHFRFGLPNPADQGRHLPDVSAAYNAIATANLLASLAANNQSVASYLCGLGPSGPLPFNMPPRFPPLPNPVFSPATSNPVLKELISASRPPVMSHDHRRQSPDTTTGRDPTNSADLIQARAVLRDSLLQKSTVPSPNLPDSGACAIAPAIASLTSDSVMPSLSLNQLSVDVPPCSGRSSGPSSVSSMVVADKTKDGRYLERRKRNNEAAKRCRANRRALFEYRFKRSQELELENADLKCQITKLRLELSNLQELVKSSGLYIEPSPAQEPVQGAQPQLPPRRDETQESGHESDFSSCGEPKKLESLVGSYASSSPESGVSSPGHALAAVPAEEHE